MNPLKFIRALSETYFYEKDKCRKNSRRCWNLLFIAFFSLYLLQIYAAFVNYEAVAGYGPERLNLEAFRQIQSRAIFLEGLVLLGVFVRVLAARFRGKWPIRFGELGELVALAAFYRHFEWTRELYPIDRDFCGPTPALAGFPEFLGSLYLLFFLGLAFCKIVLIIALAWKTVRK